MIEPIITALMKRLGEVRGVENPLTFEPDDFGRGAAWPMISEVVYHDTAGINIGVTTMDLMITITTGRQSAREATKRWYELMSPETVQRTLESDPTLGGTCQDLTVISSSPDAVNVGEALYPAIVFNIQIMF